MTALNQFDPVSYRPVHRPSMGLTGDAATASIDVSGWEKMKALVNPAVWAWYDAHKDLKVTKVFGFFTITYGSFGILEMALTAIFGPRTSL